MRMAGTCSTGDCVRQPWQWVWVPGRTPPPPPHRARLAASAAAQETTWLDP